MITRHNTIKLMAGFSLLPLANCSSKTGWKFADHNPVLGGELGSCFDPYVIFDNATYRMWFSLRDMRGIAYTESQDGISWSTPALVLPLPAEHPNLIDINRCSVLKRGPQNYQMWFTGQTKTQSHLYTATSPDGLQWTCQQSTPILTPEFSWEKTSVMCPDVIMEPHTQKLRLYYSAGEQYEPDCIGLATSDDGITWSKNDHPIFTANPTYPWEQVKVTACDIHYDNGWYYMFYIGFSDIDHATICLARSRDGISNWERHPRNPILRPPGALHYFQWNRDALYKPAAIKTDTGWVMFLNARRRHKEQIGLATYKGHDLWHPS